MRRTIPNSCSIRGASGLSFGGAITGTGSVTQSGAGIPTQTNTGNGYTGGTTVTAGMLQARAAGTFVANAAYTVNGGTLDLIGHNLFLSNLSGSGTIALGSMSVA